ncbi:transcription factor A, mitochondrial isoform X2 [Austrofundulus limnaeus]|uniref:Transcription factor A, mitochondrial n=1 Tax=Austrofundulus limnaeus TaxID=52670 RepID=A0A2I4BDT8_AUSLI|nr:PREDICTED: transcription factor A, mitochondrial-like isoform X2 [Austrofundulus limnaeus]
MTATVSLLAKSFGVCSSIGNPARYAFCSANINPVKYVTTEASGPPKRPMNGYTRYIHQQHPLIASQYPEMKVAEIIRKLAQQWRMMSPEQKEPFRKACLLGMEQYKLDVQKFKAQLSPAQLQELATKKKMRLKKRKAIQRKLELNRLGKPKGTRSAFNFFMSAQFLEAKGDNIPAKLMSLMEDWKNLSSHDKKVYTQLAEDDKIRYKNDMELWEDYMAEIGREDLLRLSKSKN